MGIFNNLFGENNKEEKAEDHFKKSLEHLNSGNFESGINELNKAIELNPTSSIYYYNRGTAKKMMLNYKEAIPDLTKSIQTIVPRISFEMTGMSYDPSRKKMSTIQNFGLDSNNSLVTQFAPVPYDFDFSLSIYVRNTEDGTQIIEQILPFFTPDFNVTVNFIPGMDQKYDMPVKLNSVNTTTDYEGDFMSTRLIMWDLTFTAKGYIWPPVQNGKIIRQTTENVYINVDSLDGQKVTVNTSTGFVCPIL